MPYGSCWGNSIGWSQANAVADTWYPITDTDIDDGLESSVTNADGTLTIGSAGDYLITYSVSVSASPAPPMRVESAIYVNAAASTNGRATAKLSVIGGSVTLSGTAMLAVLLNDTVRIAVRTPDSGGPTLACDSLSITALKLA